MQDKLIQEFGLCYFKSGLELHKDVIRDLIKQEKKSSKVTSTLTFAQAAKKCMELMTNEFRFNGQNRDLLLIAASELEVHNTCAKNYSEEFIETLLSLKPELLYVNN